MFTGRIAPNVSRSLSISASAAGAGQSQPTKGHADQPHHHGDDAPGYPLAGANTTVGSGHDQSTDDQADRPQHQGHDGPASPVVPDTTGGTEQRR